MGMGPPGESAACRGLAADASAWRARLGLRRLMMLYRLPVTIFGAGHVTSAVARTWTAEHGVALAAAHGLAGFDRAGVTGRLSRTSSQRRHLGVRRHRGRPTREDGAMRFMLLTKYGQVESDCQPMTEWTPGDIKAHIEFQHALNQELAESGELVDAPRNGCCGWEGQK